MTWLLRTEKQLVAEWVGHMLGGMEFHGAYAIGVMDGDKIIAGVVYTNYYTDTKKRPLGIEMSIASVDKAWATRHNLKEFFAYPFTYLDVKRVTATCARKDIATRQFLTRLGFKLEGIGRKAWPKGGDCAAYSMLKHECKWGLNGQVKGSGGTGSIRNSERAIEREQRDSAMERLS